jgi:hypothetical protein
MATIAAREQAEPQALSGASWRALVASFLGWLFDGYETYALILVAPVVICGSGGPTSAVDLETASIRHCRDPGVDAGSEPAYAAQARSQAFLTAR